MQLEWFVIEVVAIFVETAASIYFLHKRFDSKYGSKAPELVFGFVIVCWGIAVRLTGIPGYEIAFTLVMLAYVFYVKFGKPFHKFIGVIILMAVLFVTSIVGAGIAALVMGTTLGATLEVQDTSRLVAIIFVKMIQVSLLYLLSKKHVSIRDIQIIPAIIIGLVIVIVIAFAIMLRVSVQTPYDEQSSLLVWSSVGLLCVTIAIFLLYELFVKEETKNANLMMNLHRLEMERGFIDEINAIYADIRAWRHEYNNNMNALKELVLHGNKDEILTYLHRISGKPLHFDTTLQSSNLILDSLVNSKMGLAKKHNIEVSIQAIYPKENPIEYSDLCTIVGNLLDNAIEACMPPKTSRDNPSDEASGQELAHPCQNTPEKRFIKFELLAKGKNLVISVQNSYFHEIRQDKGRYLSSKGGLFNGLGLSLLDSAVSKYSGHIMRNHENGVFETHVIIPLVGPKGTEEKQNKSYNKECHNLERV